MANPKMMQKLLRIVSASLVVALIAATHSAQLRAETFSEADKLFALKVYPTLQAKCFACHGDDLAELKGELDLRSLQGMKLGGESGAAALVPGKPGEGLLMGAVRWEDLEMPPKANDRLTDEQINALEIWIAAGAPWPNQEARAQMQRQEREILQTDAGLLVATSGGQSDEWTYRRYRPEDIWAFQALDFADQQDAFTDTDHPIDFFIERRLAEKNLRPTAKATPEELIRRASYDVIGLPPTPEQVAEFLNRWEEIRNAPGKNFSSVFWRVRIMEKGGHNIGWMSCVMLTHPDSPTILSVPMPGGIATTSFELSTTTNPTTNSSLSNSRAMRLSKAHQNQSLQRDS